MRRSNHIHRTDFGFGILKVMGTLSFKRRTRSSVQRAVLGSETNRGQWAQTFWGHKFIKSVSLVLALLCSASMVLADVKITTKSTAGGQSITSTTYIKGARQRTEGMGYTSIYQCDLKRMIQINDKTRSYLITPLGNEERPGSKSLQKAGANTRRGGVVTYTTTITDTGERKEILGLTARYLKSKTVIKTSEGACSQMNMEMETEGWYVDLPGGLSCAAEGTSAPQFTAGQSDCVDEVRFVTEGTGKLGYPVMTTTKIKFNTGEDGPAVNIPTSSSTQEVVNLSNVALDAALFDIPSGYREVKSAQELGSPF
jgi:hypothetical protein